VTPIVNRKSEIPKIGARLWEVDALRGLAVVAMIFFHFMWDLWFYRLTYEDVVGPAWQTFARGIGSTFIFVLGLSVTLDYSRTTAKGLDTWARTIKRGLLIFGCGLLVSIGTYFFVGNEWVRFGILHHAGAAIILAYFFMRLPAVLVGLIGLAMIALGSFLSGQPGPSEWLVPFGLVPPGLNMVDYYPLLPWFGVALLGVAFGKTAYANGARKFSLPELGNIAPIRLLRFLGRHSLAVYLVHQLVLMGVLLALMQLGLIGPLF
jgi:uncharacterized membrane protein